MSKKRVHSDSDSEDDGDYEAMTSGQNKGPTRRAPKRQAASGVAHAVRSVEAPLGSDEDYDDERGSREDISGDERAQSSAKRSSTATKAKRRIDSDDDSDADPSASPPPNDDPVTKSAGKLKIRIVPSKARKPVKEERPSRSAADTPPTKKSALPKRPSVASSAHTATAPIIKKNSARPTDSNLSSSRDLDLNNPATMMSLFKSTAGTAPNKEQQPGVHEALRAEARRIREAEAKNTFDLMASSEKIRAFESCLEGMGVWPLPQVLLHPLSTTAHSHNAPPNASQQQPSQ